MNPEEIIQTFVEYDSNKKRLWNLYQYVMQLFKENYNSDQIMIIVNMESEYHLNLKNNIIGYRKKMNSRSKYKKINFYEDTHIFIDLLKNIFYHNCKIFIWKRDDCSGKWRPVFCKVPNLTFNVITENLLVI